MNAPARIKAARILRTPEQPIHEGIVQLLKFCAAPKVIWYAVPNGGYRSKRTAAMLKAQGVRAGVADIALVLPGGQSAFVEVKAPHGRQSPEQREFEAAVSLAGARYAIVRSIDEARAVLASWGALKGREAA
jgi:rhodanese-related sulfurtransferase